MVADGEAGDRESSVWARVARRVLRAATPERRIEELLRFLETFPTGRYNRRAAEAVEEALRRIRDPATRDRLRVRLRSVRAPYMPPIEPGSWPED